MRFHPLPCPGAAAASRPWRHACSGHRPAWPTQYPAPPKGLSGWSLTETLTGALPLSPTGGEAGASFDLGPPATASSNLPVDYASTTPGVCTVSGAAVTMVSAGTCRLTASQPGNTLWLAAADVSQDIELVAIPVSPPPPPAPGPGPGAASPLPVPALGPWALAWLGTLAAGLGAISLRRRARHSSAR